MYIDTQAVHNVGGLTHRHTHIFSISITPRIELEFILQDFFELHCLSAFLVVFTVDSEFRDLQIFFFGKTAGL